MAIKCPYCAFVIELKGIRAGHFNPKCPRCGEKFGLVIHPDAQMQPTVTATTDQVAPSVADALGIKEKPPVRAQPVHPQPPRPQPARPQSVGTHAT
ncbi:MAG: IS1 family transposase, partial [Burkholderiales bacterium]|nr:IS1 family transposase [Phycisphaerae bacterium]